MGEKKDLEVVSGDGSSLDISPVYEHINTNTPKSSNEHPKNIVVPKESKKELKSSKDDKKEDN